MNPSPRKMPSQLKIRQHWADRLWSVKGYDSRAEFLEPGTCFACGLDGIERAHIVARVAGGSDDAENLHILCGTCHKDSEYLEGPRYMEWLMERTAVDKMMSQAMRAGFNASILLRRTPSTKEQNDTNNKSTA